MTELEKVIKSIEDCVFHNHDCVGCDYDGCVFKHGDCRRDLLADALELLKEQEDLGTELENAVELIHKKNERIEKLLKEQEPIAPYQHDAVWLCGNCEKEVVGWDDDIDGKEYRYPFCRQCGHEVKW